MLSLFELSIEQLKLKEKLKVPALLQEAKPGTDKFEPGTEGSSKVCVCVFCKIMVIVMDGYGNSRGWVVSYNILMGSDHAPNMSHVTKNAEGRYPDPQPWFPHVHTWNHDASTKLLCWSHLL